MAKRKRSDIREEKKKARLALDEQLNTGVFTKDFENDEMDYELQPRTLARANTVEGLPIKRADGTIERVVREADVKPESDDDDDEDDEDGEGDEGANGEEEDGEADGESANEEDEEEDDLSPTQRLVMLKEEIADLAGKLMEDPEENLAALTRLNRMATSKNPVTAQLAVLALVPIYKSLAPGYRIRQLSEMEQKERVSKEVARLRAFEQNLVSNYQKYLDLLQKLVRSKDNVHIARVAGKAACELAGSLRHFNFHRQLIEIVVGRLRNRPANPEDLAVYTRSVEVLESLLEDDVDGAVTVDVVTVLSRVIKLSYRVDESALNVLLHLQLLRDYNPEATVSAKRKHMVQKKDRVHLSKKQRKARKEMIEIEEEMSKAKQEVTAEERERNQAQVLQAVLKLYLQILKAGIHEGNRNARNLFGSVLEGLAKFGRMANFDLLGDFFEVLKEIMGDMTSGEEEVDVRLLLLCAATCFTLLLNHADVGKVAIDMSSVVQVVYQSLDAIGLDADIEYSHKTLRLADPLTSDKPTVNVSTTAELLLRTLDATFFKSRNGTPVRALAFTKRLYMESLHLPEKSALAVLKFIGKLMARFPGIGALYSTEESSGEGNYILGIESNLRSEVVEVARSQPEAATLWENVLLDKHYNPQVRDGSRSLMKQSKETNK
ncbi:hypothetical protein DIURU_002311 [Diutina rugosa]|uniref:Nucleolar complex-associated protein 3 n=1 Tax=Diutina rugosa TaxID=5481 RepID=A0A642UR84_DIURU|nr:uncharacterized protein DIURU_002311 [Diutina rugosa]KAA8903799.1 hypothetical protein DIURU_002311 [Diutina rugosa]